MRPKISSLSQRQRSIYRHKIFYAKAERLVYRAKKWGDFQDPIITRCIADLQRTAYNQGRKDSKP